MRPSIRGLEFCCGECSESRIALNVRAVFVVENGAVAVTVVSDANIGVGCADEATEIGEIVGDRGVYLGVAFVSLFVPPLQPLVASYYLVQRRRAVGTP